MEKLTYTHNDAAAKALAAFYETPPLAYVRSYGCQQNVNDGERIKGVLVDIGYGLCDKPEDADLILFNTCAVREHAEQRVFGNVGALKKLKEQNPRLMIGVCGCMAQQEHIVEKLRQSYPYVDLVFGVDGIDRLPAMLAELGARADLTQVRAVGVSARPRPVEGSYMPCFLAGVSAATAFSLSRALPLIELTHQQGHIAAALYAAGDFTLFERESLVFHVSGGTTDLLLCHGAERITPLGTSSDLYAGQAVDRLGVKLGFPFPAGVYVSEQAALCKEKVHPKVSVHGLTCSLSGLENQCAKLLADGHDAPYVCKYCLLCVGETLVRMANNALAEHTGLPVVFAGGVMSSDLIRTYVTNRVPNAHFVPGKFASDNAIGISILAARECGAWPTTSM